MSHHVLVRQTHTYTCSLSHTHTYTHTLSVRNFTKFLCDSSGRPVRRYGPKDNPSSMEADIREQLGLPPGDHIPPPHTDADPAPSCDGGGACSLKAKGEEGGACSLKGKGEEGKGEEGGACSLSKESS